MACSCGKSQAAAQSVPFSSTSPAAHAILPTQSCLFCAEKHFAVGYDLCSRFGVSDHNRLAVLGELEAARRHTRLEYPDIAAALALAEQLVAVPDGQSPMDLMDSCAELLSAELGKTSGGTDSKGSGGQGTSLPVSPVIDMPSTLHPLIGVVLFSCAWRLAFETGYERPNRYFILGDLTLAQMHFSDTDSQLAGSVRELRHSVQNRSIRDDAAAWAAMARRVDTAQRTGWHNALREKGTDISGFFGSGNSAAAQEGDGSVQDSGQQDQP